MRSFAVLAALGVSVLASAADVSAAQAQESNRVGNMKRIIVPEKGEPRTVIGTPTQTNSPANTRPLTPTQVRVRAFGDTGNGKARPVNP
jgi:hypothetical protein